MDVDNLCMGCLEPRGDEPTCAACGWVEGSAPVNAVHLKPRTVVHGHYVLGRALGHGGFGIAYIAWDTNLQMKVAVKEFLPGDHATRGTNGTTVTPYSGDSREHFEYGLTKFLDEGRAVARFNDHPGIMPVLGFFRENGTGYLVMQYVPGMTLKKYLDLKGGRIPFAHAVDIAMPVMDTLRVVHEVGLLHRDISPDNIYITTAARVKLLDFGAARHALGDRSQSLSTILKSGYAPFEQYQTRGRQGPYTAVSALAATLYRCVTGEPPVEAPSRVTRDELQPLQAFDIEISDDAEAVLMKAMSMDPKQRYQRVQELQEALATVTADRRMNFDGSPIGTVTSERSLPPLAETAKAASLAQDSLPAAGQASAGDGAAVHRAPGPSFAERLRGVVDLIERPSSAIGDVVQRLTGLRLAPDAEAAARQGGLVLGAIFGALGVLFSLSILLNPAPYGVPAIGMSSTIWQMRVLGALLGSVWMALGGIAGLAGDRRGGLVVWASGWAVLAFAVAGMALQLVGYLLYTTIAIWMMFEVPGEIWRTVPALTPTVIILLLLWMRTSSQAASPGATDKTG